MRFPKRKFNIIYADPAWSYNGRLPQRGKVQHYPIMEHKDICALSVKDIAADSCCLFMWVTFPKLEDGLKVIKAWGFEYRTCFVWVKDRIGMGYHARNQHEILLVAKRGQFPPPPVEVRVSSVVEAPRTAHSAKPEKFHELIESFYPDAPKLELFARNQRDGWSVWGNQAGGK